MGKESHQSENAATHEVLSTVQDVDIDFEGRFKYILIRISIGNAFKHIVRGYARCGFHADVLEEVEPELKAKGLKVSCKGGGRIEHQYKKISVYGYSQGFGKADHKMAVDILKSVYPDYASITWSDDGY